MEGWREGRYMYRAELHSVSAKDGIQMPKTQIQGPRQARGAALLSL